MEIPQIFSDYLRLSGIKTCMTHLKVSSCLDFISQKRPSSPLFWRQKLNMLMLGPGRDDLAILNY